MGSPRKSLYEVFQETFQDEEAKQLFQVFSKDKLERGDPYLVFNEFPALIPASYCADLCNQLTQILTKLSPLKPSGRSQSLDRRDQIALDEWERNIVQFSCDNLLDVEHGCKLHSDYIKLFGWQGIELPRSSVPFISSFVTTIHEQILGKLGHAVVATGSERAAFICEFMTSKKEELIKEVIAVKESEYARLLTYINITAKKEPLFLASLSRSIYQELQSPFRLPRLAYWIDVMSACISKNENKLFFAIWTGFSNTFQKEDIQSLNSIERIKFKNINSFYEQWKLGKNKERLYVPVSQGLDGLAIGSIMMESKRSFVTPSTTASTLKSLTVVAEMKPLPLVESVVQETKQAAPEPAVAKKIPATEKPVVIENAAPAETKSPEPEKLAAVPVADVLENEDDPDFFAKSELDNEDGFEVVIPADVVAPSSWLNLFQYMSSKKPDVPEDSPTHVVRI